MDEKRIIQQLTEKYDKVYQLEKQRNKINKEIKIHKQGLYALLDYLRNKKREDKK
jgi:hypothetical protein